MKKFTQRSICIFAILLSCLVAGCGDAQKKPGGGGNSQIGNTSSSQDGGEQLKPPTQGEHELPIIPVE